MTKKNNKKWLKWLTGVGSFLYCIISILPQSVRATIIFQNDDFATIESTGIILNSDNENLPTSNLVLQFGSAIAETITWNNTLGRFVISDDIDISNNQAYNFRAENIVLPATMGNPGAGAVGRIVELTGTGVDSTSPGCTGPSCPPGTYSWNGTIWKPLQGTVTTATATKIVTVGPSGRDYTSISAAAAYCNTLSGCEMWVDPGSFSVTTSVDLENVRVIGADIGQTTITITGAGVLRVKDTRFRDLTLNINPTATYGLDVKYNASSSSTVEFDQVDFIVAAFKVLMDSSAGTPPTTITQFINCTESGGSGALVAAFTPSNLGGSSTFTVVDQTGLNALNLVDWNVTIIGGSNVYTTGTITTIPDRTIFVSPGMKIQEAIDSLGSSGGVIKLGVGTHNITTSLSIAQNNIELIGEGPGTVLTTTSWTGGTTNNDCVIQVGTANGTSPRSNINIRNFKVQVTPNIHGICVNGGNDNKVMDMTVESAGTKSGTRTAIVITDGATTEARRITVSRNTVTRADAGSCSDISNPTNQCWVDGVHYDGDAFIAGALFGYDGNGVGISDSIISENIVNEAKETSYAFSSVSASGIFSNRARNIGYSGGALGLYLQGTQDVMVINNTLEGNNIASARGIILDNNVDDSVIMGNAVRGTTPYAAGIDVEDASSERNIISNNQFNTVTDKVRDDGTNTKSSTTTKSTVNPGTGDDILDGYGIGTLWINTATDTSWVCVDDTSGAAVWVQLTSSQTGTPNSSWNIDNDNSAGNISLLFGDGTPTNESLVWNATSLRFDLSDGLNVAGDLALTRSDLTLAGGTNNDIAIGNSSFVKISGPGAAFSVTGIAGGRDGKIVTLYNSTSQTMTIANNSASSAAANRILTLTGTDRLVPGLGTITLKYDSAVNNWVVTSMSDTFALSVSNLTLVSGNNNDVTITNNEIQRISGPGAAFTVTGIAGGVNGRKVTLYNTTGNNMTIANNSGSSAAANRILTLTGGNINTTGTGAVTLIYDGTASNWYVYETQL